MSGLYTNPVLVERFSSAVALGNLAQPFVAPCDLDVVGLVAVVITPPGGSVSLTVNVTDTPVSQLANVGPYSLWTAANVPTITGTSTRSYTTSANTAVVENRPYALNYPLPGPSGLSGYETAQATSPITQDPVTAPPTIFEYQMGALIAPDNTYADFNGFTTPASIVHEGDVLTFMVGGGVGSAAGLEVVLYAHKR